MTTKMNRLVWIAGAVVLAGGVSALLRGPQGLSAPFEMFGQIREYQKSNRALEVEIGDKKERLRRLDDLILELRDSLGATIVVVSHELPSIFAIIQGRVKSVSASLDPTDPHSAYFTKAAAESLAGLGDNI